MAVGKGFRERKKGSSHKERKGHKKDLAPFPLLFFVYFVFFVAMSLLLFRESFVAEQKPLVANGPLASTADGAGQAHQQAEEAAKVRQQAGPVDPAMHHGPAQ